MKSPKIVTLENPTSHASECYKMCRTNIHYLHTDENSKVFVISSSVPSEGKTTSAVNLAVTFSEAGKKVLLIDCDLRKSNVHNFFGLEQTPGLTNYLSDSKPFETILSNVESVKSLDILTSGVLPPNPSELLDSQKMKVLIEKARQSYDYILIDTPPILSVTDATILSKYSDGVIIVVSYGETKEDELKRTIKHLKDLKIKVLGSILTKAKVKKTSYNSYYGKK